MKRILLHSIVILLSCHVFGQTTIENFAYGTITGTAADTLTNPSFGGSVWRRHSGSGGPITYRGTSLNYTGYASSGTGGSAGFSFASTSREDANRSTIIYNSGSVYTSFLLRITASGGTTGDYFFGIMDTAAITSFRGRLYIRDGSVANTYKIGLNKGSSAAPVYSTLDYPIDSTVLVVLKYKFDATVNDTIFTYVFTSGIPSTEPSTPTLTSTDIATADLALFNAVFIRQGTVGTMAGIVDGIRVSNTWAQGPLPVKLTAFDATIKAKSTILTWSTSSEMNNSGFEIERSTDGVDFENIGFVKGAGNSNTTRDYSFNHDNAEDAFYRLKQIDFDGKTTYSPVISVQNTKAEADLNPNPFNEFIKVTTNSTISRAEIVDMMGKVVLSENVNSNNVQLDAKNLLNGVYFIRIYQGDAVITKRIIKAN